MEDLIRVHRRRWKEKPALAELYTRQIFRRIEAHLVPGSRIVEVGAGPGFFKVWRGDVVATDVGVYPWLDICCDATCLPFPDGTVDALIGSYVARQRRSPQCIRHA